MQVNEVGKPIILSHSEAPNGQLFLTIIGGDTELLEAATRDGFVNANSEMPSNREPSPELPSSHHPHAFSHSVSPEATSDNSIIEEYASTMNATPLDELASTISAIEERMDKRIERMERDSERRADDLRREMRLRERSARRESIAMKGALQAHIESNDKAVTSTLSALERTEAEFGKVKQANKEQRYWMAGIGVAIVLGIMGANATIFGGGKTFFDGGANSVINQQQVEKLIQESRAQSEANNALLKEIQARQESMAVPNPSKP